MKKVRLSSGKKFMIVSTIKLLIIQIIFLLIAVFIADFGNRTSIQFSIFYSWLILPISYLKYFKSSSDTVLPELIIYFFSIPVIFFLFSMFVLIFVWKEKVKKTALALIILFHLAGTLLVIISSYHESWLFYPLSIGVSVFALLASFLFWRIFFQIADYKSKTSNTEKF
jgi:hypothetical protein